ncbi:uncharacterized protein C2orf42 homolog [Diorhabda sublineata]|uniref:uncharacterized protein C2orf42 homolog n=1 Tax=Diorhabda sublineata TaxID=1163346 RepID=UPI0024E0A5BA|nr:uncharacterized protein C2orf42 homolog [Diorhabda sublineata]
MLPNQKRQLYTSLLTMSEDFSEYPQKLLSGLGKSTKRGIKKCSVCGVYNGTRSITCKNKSCNAVLKPSEEKSKLDLDAVKLLTNTEKQVYSVKISDMGSDYRGFVQLPVLQSCTEKDTSNYSEVAICFVDSCQNSFDNSILKCHEEERTSTDSNKVLCTHIKSALKSQNEASPIELKLDVLHSLNIKNYIKQRLCLLNSEKEGTLVQRVSKSVIVVKCHASAKHPLGYLHFTFIKGNSKDVYEKFDCGCSNFPVLEILDHECSHGKQKCIHYYACIWALVCEGKCDEYASIVTCETSRDLIIPKNIELTKVNTSYTANVTRLQSKLKVLPKIREKSKLHRKKQSLKRCHRIMPKILPIEIKVLKDTPKPNDMVSWGFIDWLSFVTESINKTMQFDNYGIVNTTILQIPEDFYKCFQQRIPNVYDVVENGNSHVYYIMNILHLKEIFDTPKIKLMISKKFVHNDQKGYVEYNENNEEVDKSFLCPFIYFLNVGQSTVDESDNTNNSFYIEWTPSLFSVINIGQLKLQYKYGRKST